MIRWTQTNDVKSNVNKFDLERISPPVGIETIAFKIQHGIHHVFDDLGSRDSARFSHVSHYEDSDPGPFGESDQPARALLHLAI